MATFEQPYEILIRFNGGEEPSGAHVIYKRFTDVDGETIEKELPAVPISVAANQDKKGRELELLHKVLGKALTESLFFLMHAEADADNLRRNQDAVLDVERLKHAGEKNSLQVQFDLASAVAAANHERLTAALARIAELEREIEIRDNDFVDERTRG